MENNVIVKKYKFFKYTRNFNVTNRYKIMVAKTDILFLRNFEKNGYRKLNESTFSITFKIEQQLFRKLKLKNIGGELDRDSVDKKLLTLIIKSKEISESDVSISDNRYYTWSSSGSNGYDFVDYEENKNRKINSKHKNNVNNHKYKQYNNNTKWLRK